MIGIHIRFYKHIRSCLAGRIRAVGRIGGCLIEIAAIFAQRAVYFIRRNMQEFLVRLKGAVRKLPRVLCAVQHHGSTQHVGLYEYLGIFDASVYMAFRRKMHHAVNIVFCKDLCNRFFIADICFYEGIVIAVFNVF